MKLYFIVAAFIFIATFSYSEYSKIENSTVYSDSTAKCPVTGDDVSGEHIAFRYIDKEIKFCNEGCIMAFKKDPAKFTKELKCMPCKDDDANHDINSVHNGVKYYFCSNGCKGKFKKEPDVYLEKFLK